jgi:hypothetical protein
LQAEKTVSFLDEMGLSEINGAALRDGNMARNASQTTSDMAQAGIFQSQRKSSRKSQGGILLGLGPLVDQANEDDASIQLIRGETI